MKPGSDVILYAVWRHRPTAFRGVSDDSTTITPCARMILKYVSLIEEIIHCSQIRKTRSCMDFHCLYFVLSFTPSICACMHFIKNIHLWITCPKMLLIGISAYYEFYHFFYWWQHLRTQNNLEHKIIFHL